MSTNIIKKAVLLAAGRGTRMRELTEDLPKPMIPVRGKPILQHIVE
ncbi:MAG: nucleotidyltransferase family protein, partial [Verrucomicrobiaceae bacterium]